MSVAILAGGLGTRLRPAVSDRPKVLAEVSGQPFLAYLLDRLAGSGVREVVLCTGYRGEQVRAAFGDAYGPIRLRYSQESSPLGTGGALRQALPLLPAQTCLALNGDSLCGAELASFLAWHRGCTAEVSMVVTHVADAGRFGRVEVDERGKLVRFMEKSAGAGPGWINAGVYGIERSVLSEIPANRPWSLERELFPAWIGRGVWGYRHTGRFLDIGLPETLHAAQTLLAAAPPGIGA